MRADRQADQGRSARGTAVGPVFDRGRPGAGAAFEGVVSAPQSDAVADQPSSCPAWKSRGAWFTLMAVVLVALLADLGSKTVAFRTLGPQPALTDGVDSAILSLRFGEAFRAAGEVRRHVEALS